MSDWETVGVDNIWEKSQPASRLQQSLKSIGGYGAGLLEGASNLGENAAQAPFDLYGWLENQEPYHVPHGSFESLKPEGADSAFTAGKITSDVGIPMLFGGATRIMPYANQLMLRTLKRAGLGALEGATLAPSGNREVGALLGAAFGQGIPFTKRGSANDFRRLSREIEGTPLSENINVPTHRLLEAQRVLSDPAYRIPESVVESGMRNAFAGQYPAIYGVTSRLGQISNRLRRQGPFEAQAGNDIRGLQQQILGDLGHHFEQNSRPDLNRLMREAREEYRVYHQNIQPVYEKMAKTLKWPVKKVLSLVKSQI